MINNDYFVEFTPELMDLLEKITFETDGSEYPETFNTALDAMGDEMDHDAFAVACSLLNCDKSKPLQEPVRDFCIMAFDMGIEEEGHPGCMYQKGELYYSSRSGLQNYKVATDYFKMALSLGLSSAAERLGEIFYYGYGTKIDYERAYIYFSIAEQLGDPKAMYMLGDMYRFGQFVEKNPGMVGLMYNKANAISCDLEDTECIANTEKRMGDLYREGLNGAINPILALQSYQDAEISYYVLLQEGETDVKKDLEYVIKAQLRLRSQIKQKLATE